MAPTKVEMLSNVTVLIGDTKAARASTLADGLREFGFGETIIALSYKETIAKLEAGGVDVAILADTLGGNVFKLIRGVRHMLVGKNPFMTLFCALAPEHVDGAKLALRAGVDSILIQPVPAKEVTDRVRKVGRGHTTYVVTSEYIGPDRRAADRTSAIRRFNVPQTLQAKLRGQSLNYEEFAKKIVPLMEDMLQTRLYSQSGRLAVVCKELLAAYQSSQITPLIRERLMALGDLLKDASSTAKQLKQKDVVDLCLSLKAKVEDFAERYTQPTEQDINLLRKLAEAVAIAAKTRVAVDFDAANSDAETASPADELDEPALEIQFIPKGQYLFREGEEAKAAYVVAAGCIGIFRSVDGKTSPVGRIREGEFFGEMAILDGSNRRANAVALEDTTLSLVSKELLEQKMEGSDKLIRSILLTSVHNLRDAHEKYTQRGRSFRDTLDNVAITKHIVGRFIDRTGVGDDTARAKELLDKFDTIFAEIKTASKTAGAKDKRLNQGLKEEDLKEVAE
ncbi:MAG: cyclic nucleotide-binding domain-containing protein [Rhodospirillaceae bacterium]